MGETGENVEAFDGRNDGFIEGIINHIFDESKKGIDGGNSNFVFSANCNVTNGFWKLQLDLQKRYNLGIHFISLRTKF